MKLSEIASTVQGILSANAYLSGLEIIAGIEAGHNQRLETALRDKGMAIVIVHAGGRAAKPDSPKLLLLSEVVISVLENPACNQTGKTAIEAAEQVLETLHQNTWETERGLRSRFQVDTPAYEAGPLDSGLIIFFCNFLVKTLQ